MKKLIENAIYAYMAWRMRRIMKHFRLRMNRNNVFAFDSLLDEEILVGLNRSDDVLQLGATMNEVAAALKKTSFYDGEKSGSLSDLQFIWAKQKTIDATTQEMLETCNIYNQLNVRDK